MSAALSLSDVRGLDAYSRYIAVSVVGGALGGVLMYACVTVLRRRLPALSTTALSASGRLALALLVGAGLWGASALLLYAVGFLVALSGVVVLAMFHSLTSRRAGLGMRARGGLLAATALGGLMGAPLAGAVVERELTSVLVAIQIPGSMAGLTVAVAFRRAFSKPPQRPGGRTPVRLRQLRPIACRRPAAVPRTGRVRASGGRAGGGRGSRPHRGRHAQRGSAGNHSCPERSARSHR